MSGSTKEEVRKQRLLARAFIVGIGLFALLLGAILSSALFELVGLLILVIAVLSMFMVGTPKLYPDTDHQRIRWRTRDRRERIKRSGGRPSDYK
jgi:hypothetical protein